jgi:alcohol dehydrogenase
LAGETVLVSGATGHFGSAAMAVALAMGAACVVAAGRNRQVLDAPIERVLDMLPPIRDAAPVRAAALAVRPHGTVVLMGGVDAPLDLPYKEVMRNSLTVRGQFMYPRDAPRRLAALIRGVCWRRITWSWPRSRRATSTAPSNTPRRLPDRGG